MKEIENGVIFKLVLKPIYKDKDSIYLPEPIGAEQKISGRYYYNKELKKMSSRPSTLTRSEFIDLWSDYKEFMSYFDVMIDDGMLLNIDLKDAIEKVRPNTNDMILNANYPFSTEKDDGPYIVKIGQYYLSKSKDGIGSIDLILERDLRDAKHMSIDKAKFMANRYGGKVLKVSVELIEV